MERLRTDLSVAIIGAGFGGLCMAAALKSAGVEKFTIFEKAEEVGGIWRDNTYPGCGCDVPSHLYSFSFEKYQNSTVRYPGQDDILQYLKDVSKKYDLRRHLLANAEIASAKYNDSTGKWIIADSTGTEHQVDVVVSAVGQLHRPRMPDIDGVGSFSGPAFHAAKWDHSFDPTDRNIAVIGTGSSAAQLLPHMAAKARKVFVFQRTPSWVLPKPKAEFDSVTSWLFNRFPFLQSAYRSLVYLAADTALSPVITRGWSFLPAKAIARWHLHRQIPDAQLRDKLTPNYPIGCKRIVIDSSFYPALARDNVELVTDGIARITPEGIDANDGTHRQVDAIIYASGFRTTEFLTPMDVHGKGGLDLHKEWQQGAEAYLGMAIPGFPNFFLVHGPNTILGHNSNVFMIECQVRYIMNCLRMLPGQIEVRPEAMTNYRAWLDKAISGTVWPTGCQSWYKTESGRVTNPWPASTMRYWYLTRRDPAPAFMVTRQPSAGPTPLAAVQDRESPVKGG